MARFGRRSANAPRTLRTEVRGRDPFLIGVLTILGIAVVSYFGFTKLNPFAHPFVLKAVFPSANSMRVNSPVRIAGVNIGKVVKVEGVKGTNNSLLTMKLKGEALPIHKDARLKIRPRIFLEGNFFVDIRPGTPHSPTLSDGDTIKVAQTAIPVQIDQVFTSLQHDTRKDLQVTLQELGSSLTRKPTPAEDADQSPIVKGKSAAEAINDAITTGEDALRGAAVQQTALLGTGSNDLTELVRGVSQVGTALESRESALVSLVDNFSTTMGALAAEQNGLRGTIRKLGPTLQTAYTTFGSAEKAFPNIRAFSLELIPGVKETPATIKALTPWITQTRALVSQDELGGLLQDLQPTTANLAGVTKVNVPLLRQGDALAKCFRDVILPTGDQKLDDGPFSTGKENYKEFWYSMVGLASEGQNFDGNGSFLRFQTGGGAYPVTLKGGNLGNEDKASGGGPIIFHGNAIGKPLGSRPAWTTKKPAYNFTSPCYKQALPDLAHTPTGASDAAP